MKKHWLEFSYLSSFTDMDSCTVFILIKYMFHFIKQLCSFLNLIYPQVLFIFEGNNFILSTTFSPSV